MLEPLIAYALIALLAVGALVGAVVWRRRVAAARKAERGLGRRGRNTIDLRTR